MVKNLINFSLFYLLCFEEKTTFRKNDAAPIFFQKIPAPLNYDRIPGFFRDT